jgi:hypothetical protein
MFWDAVFIHQQFQNHYFTYLIMEHYTESNLHKTVQYLPAMAVSTELVLELARKALESYRTAKEKVS